MLLHCTNRLCEYFVDCFAEIHILCTCNVLSFVAKYGGKKKLICLRESVQRSMLFRNVNVPESHKNVP